MPTIRVLDPTQRDISQVRSTRSVGSLAGLRVGFLNNGWMSWDALITELTTQMREQHGAVLSGQWRVPVSSPAPDEVLNRAGETSGLILAGLAN